MKKLSVFLPVLFSLAGGCVTAEPDYEAIYQERFKALMANGGMMSPYEPLEEISGANNYLPLPAASNSEVVFSEEALAKATEYAEQNNSAAFIVWHKGEVQTASYFAGTTAETPLVSKSLSKPLSAIAVGRAIALGAIDSLDQSVSDFITEWKGTPKEGVLVRHLLDMRSGFLPQGFSRDPDSPWNRAYISPIHGKYIVEEYPLTDEPGTRYGYSNATADMVAVLIERSTGQRYGDFVSKEILAPVGAPGGSIWVDREGGLAHSGCCMYMPAETWLRLGVLMLNDGVSEGERLLPEGYVKEMSTGTDKNVHYGLGIWVGQPYAERRGYSGKGGPGPQVLHSEPYLDPDLYLFDGNSNQVVYILPGHDTVILRMGPTPPKSPEWDNSYLPNLLIRDLAQ